MPGRLATRLLIIGWDAADWKVIDPLLAQGKMPSLRRLIDAGVRADLRSLDPKLSPLLWTSIATGKTADKHGILNFIEPAPDGAGLRPSCSPTRRTRALWNILTQSGMRTNVVSWYASHPAEPVNGCIVSNLFQDGPPPKSALPWPMPPGAVHPPELAGAVARARLRPAQASAAELRMLVPALASIRSDDARVPLLSRQLAQGASVQGVASLLLKARRDWDCTMVFFEAIDVVGHHFMQYYPPRMAHVSERDFEHFRHVMPGIYQVQDTMLGRLLSLAGADTTVMVLSDHGFHSDHLRPRMQAAVDDAHAAMDATWHRPHGVLVMAGPGIAAGRTLHSPGLLDITPTALTLLGLPIGADMDGRVLVEALEPGPEVARIPSWDDAPGDAGLHPADLRVDPFEAREAMKQLEDLGYVSEMPEGVEAQVALCDRETRFNLGVVLMTTSRPGRAVEVFERLHREHPEEQRFAMNLASCLYAVGRHERAIAILNDLVARFPDSPDSRLLRATTLLAQGNAGEAVAALEDAASRTPDRVDVLCALADAQARVGRLDDADRTLLRAATFDPHNPVPPHRHALLDLARGRYESAAERSLTALELRHLFPEAHYALGVALAWMGSLPYAVQSFNVAISMQPGLVDAHLFAAAIHRHMNDPARAAPHEDAAAGLIASREEGAPIPNVAEEPYGPAAWVRSRAGGAASA